jgi:hypothetical protein
MNRKNGGGMTPPTRGRGFDVLANFSGDSQEWCFHLGNNVTHIGFAEIGPAFFLRRKDNLGVIIIELTPK